MLDLKKKISALNGGNSTDSTIRIDGAKSAKGEFGATLLPEFLRQRYKMRRFLGRGAFGMVFLAEDRKIGRLVAIKQLFDSEAGDDTIRQRFMQEARIAGQLEHPNIVIVYNIEGDGDSACIVMEYLGGGSLAELLRKERIIEPRTAVRMFLGILSGLEAAHHIMVIHRDVKPQNILFGIGITPKITDFGVAHLPADAGGDAQIDSETERRLIIGTPVYMAPEQISQAEVGFTADLYAAGAVLYEMLGGQKILPISSDMTIEQARDIIAKKTPTPLRDIRPDLPESLTAIVHGLLEKNPANRPQDCMTTKKAIIKCISELNFTPDDMHAELMSAPTTQILNSPATILEDIIRLLLIDGHMSPPERAELRRRTERLGLSEIQSNAIEEKVRGEMGLPPLRAMRLIRKIAAKEIKNGGGKISETQRTEFFRQGQRLGIKRLELEEIIGETIAWLREKGRIVSL